MTKINVNLIYVLYSILLCYLYGSGLSLSFPLNPNDVDFFYFNEILKQQNIYYESINWEIASTLKNNNIILKIINGLNINSNLFAIYCFYLKNFFTILFSVYLLKVNKIRESNILIIFSIFLILILNNENFVLYNLQSEKLISASFVYFLFIASLIFFLKNKNIYFFIIFLIFLFHPIYGFLSTFFYLTVKILIHVFLKDLNFKKVLPEILFLFFIFIFYNFTFDMSYFDNDKATIAFVDNLFFSLSNNYFPFQKGVLRFIYLFLIPIALAYYFYIDYKKNKDNLNIFWIGLSFFIFLLSVSQLIIFNISENIYLKSLALHHRAFIVFLPILIFIFISNVLDKSITNLCSFKKNINPKIFINYIFQKLIANRINSLIIFLLTINIFSLKILIVFPLLSIILFVNFILIGNKLIGNKYNLLKKNYYIINLLCVLIFLFILIYSLNTNLFKTKQATTRENFLNLITENFDKETTFMFIPKSLTYEFSTNPYLNTVNDANLDNYIIILNNEFIIDYLKKQIEVFNNNELFKLNPNCNISKMFFSFPSSFLKYFCFSEYLCQAIRPLIDNKNYLCSTRKYANEIKDTSSWREKISYTNFDYLVIPSSNLCISEKRKVKFYFEELAIISKHNIDPEINC
jgi:hypothetical protein